MDSRRNFDFLPVLGPDSSPHTSDDEENHEHMHVPELNVSIILLAAGSSSRLGHSKQLLDIEGSPLLLQSTKVALESRVKNVLVILGANEVPHREVIHDLPVSIISNHFWKSGMGSSIKAGLNHLVRKAPDTQAVIIMVCDQPSLTANHLRQLIQKYRETKSPIVASSYAGTAGVPVLFSRAFFSNILMLRDGEGAKKIIQQFPGQILTIEFPEGVFDLDTSVDYQNYLKRKEKSHPNKE